MKYKTDQSKSLDHYLASIRYTGQIKRQRKLNRLKKYLEGRKTDLDNILRVAIIGPGSDIELDLLHSVIGGRRKSLPPQVYCIDISHRILQALRQMTSRYQLSQLGLVCSDASKLPFSMGTFDLVISSSLQHEIFSYSGGERAVENSFQEYSRLLNQNGILFIRDFECPPHEDQYAIQLETDSARKFWSNYLLYFRKAYAESVPYQNLGGLVVLNSYAATDFMTHFAVKSLYDPDHAEIETWKEINEHYITLSSKWYSQNAEKYGLHLIFNLLDLEPEQEEIIRTNMSCFVLESGGRLKKISPFCTRFNLLFAKKGV
jgi:SAM-dependent methyltransferase